VCEIDEKLGDNAFETHEVNNGMRPLWVSIHEVIAHNENMVAKNDKKGLSIERETYLLRHVVAKLLSVSELAWNLKQCFLYGC
jgi:hypothetical protein